MASPSRPTLEAQLARALRDRQRRARDRMARAVAGPRWERMARIVPVLYRREGPLAVHELLCPWDEAVAALRAEGAVFAHDTALRLTRGYGFLAGGDVFAYLTEGAAIERLAARGVVAREAHGDTALVRPWAGPPRLVACVVATPPPHRLLADGTRVVTDARLRAELLGVVGLRPDLFALAE